MSDSESLADTYCVAGPNSLRGRLIARARQKIYLAFQRCVPAESMSSVLDVGVTADRVCAYSNFFEQMFPYPERITAFSDQDASWMREVWPGLSFVQGDACQLPFADGKCDLVFSSAVIEHVGSRMRQRQFLKECCRVASKYVFLTTPDRHFPIEMHSMLPLLHWLPARLFRKILRLLGYGELAQESNLNLLTYAELRQLCHEAGIENFHINRFRFFGFPSNLLLTIEKK